MDIATQKIMEKPECGNTECNEAIQETNADFSTLNSQVSKSSLPKKTIPTESSIVNSKSTVPEEKSPKPVTLKSKDPYFSKKNKERINAGLEKVLETNFFNLAYADPEELSLLEGRIQLHQTFRAAFRDFFRGKKSPDEVEKDGRKRSV